MAPLGFVKAIESVEDNGGIGSNITHKSSEMRSVIRPTDDLDGPGAKAFGLGSQAHREVGQRSLFANEDEPVARSARDRAKREFGKGYPRRLDVHF